jgi:drug/metabolite transporter (DMT)-like permease
MTGTAWAALAGVGFGIFQVVNRKALRELDVYRSTFLQLLVSAVVLVAASSATQTVDVLAGASWTTLANFAVAGLIHFFVGWTFLNASQKRIGAARASPLLATTPLFGTVIAALALREIPGPITLAGVVVIVAGVVVGSEGEPEPAPGPEAEPEASPGSEGEAGGNAPAPGRTTGLNGGRETAGPIGSATFRTRQRARSDAVLQTVRGRLGVAFGLATALAWAISPVFIRAGLEDLPSPLLAVTISMVTAVLAYGVALVVTRRRHSPSSMSRSTLRWKLLAGVLVGISTWLRWLALDQAAVAVVLALGLLSVPTVIALAPLILGRRVERITVRVVAGAALVVTGSMGLVWLA